MVKRSFYTVLPLLGLAACATGGNIKGDFACSAPGGTCAPMGSIDASAIASIGSGRSMPMSGGGIDSPRIQRSLSGQVIAVGGEPQRTSDRVLRVVFPAHIDGDGIFREEAAAHAVFESSEWAQALGVRPQQPRSGVALRAGGVEAVAAPASALATLDEIVAARAASAAVLGASPMASQRPEAPVAAYVTPAGVQPSNASATMRPALVMPFQSSATRAAQPQSLAEAAAGLEAPRIPRLDPRDPAANYDTPDVVAAPTKVAVAAPPAFDDRSANQRTRIASDQSRQTADARPTTAAPYGTRPVRWKGRTYNLPYRSPQPVSSARNESEPQQPNLTAALNKAALARSMSPTASAADANGPAVPAYAPTVDAGDAKARVSAMAAPVISDAVAAGRTAAAASAPGGMKLPLPTKAADLSELARLAPGANATGTPQ